jgi:hypothetical protein
MKSFLNNLLTCDYMSNSTAVTRFDREIRKVMVMTAAIASLATASVSWAAPITLQYNGIANGGMNGQITKTSPAPTFSNMSVRAGQFDFNVITSPDSVKWNSTLQAFCIDVDNTLKHGTVTYDIVSATATPGGLTSLQLARVGWLYDNHASDLGSSAQFDAAFQLTLWEIFFEQGATLRLNNGTFQSNTFGTVNGMMTRNLANSLLDGIGDVADDYRSSDWEFYVLNPVNPSNNQRLITALPFSTPSVEISEPGTLVLLLAGLGIALFSMRHGTGMRLRA